MRSAAVLLVLSLAVAACGSGSKHAKKTTSLSPCPLIASLDATAATVAHADVADPVAFKRTLDAAVVKYLATVQQLRNVTPNSLHDDLDRLEAAVHQYRFQDAVTMRSSLDAYAASTCDHVATGLDR